MFALLRHATRALLLLAIGSLPTAHAQTAYPTKPVRIIIAFGPGTGLDVMSRAFAERLTEQMKQSFVVENREGAGGTIGVVAAARSAPDGYTILFAANGPFAISPWQTPQPPYDPVNDFVGITRVGVVPMILVASTKAPFRNFEEMVAYARANPGKLDYASSGVGTPSQLSVELIKRALKLDIRAVPYKSTAQAMTDTIAGQVPLYMPSFPATLNQIKAGQVRGLAIGLSRRSDVMPDIPTVAEATRQPDFETVVRYGFLAPKGTPAEIVTRLDAEIQKSLGTPQITTLFQKVGATRSVAGPRDFAAQIRSDAEFGKKFIESMGEAAR